MHINNSTLGRPPPLLSLFFNLNVSTRETARLRTQTIISSRFAVLASIPTKVTCNIIIEK